MGTDAVRQKIEEIVRDAVIAARPGTKVAYENVKFAQPRGEPWVHVAVVPNRSGRKDIGETRTFRHMGVAVINIMVPEDTGTKTSTELTDAVFNALADTNFALGADGYLKLCFAEKRNRGVVNGWYTRNVQVEYHNDAAA